MTNLLDRTFVFSKSIILYCSHFPQNNAGRNISNQLFRSGTSVGANYRAARRSRSDREFISKMNIVLEEADESLFWLQIIKSTEFTQLPETDCLLNEAEELVKISVTILKKMNGRQDRN
jgi:four helix bundle protein